MQLHFKQLGHGEPENHGPSPHRDEMEYSQDGFRRDELVLKFDSPTFFDMLCAAAGCH